jgi:hypothetical protein
MLSEPQVVEGEVRELPERALAVVAERTQVIMGSASLALMSEADFAANLQALQVQRKRGDEIKRALMAEGTDYGTVPGVPKAFLWKSGAETLDKAFGLVATFDVRRVSADREDVPPYSFHAHALIHVGSADGPVVGEGFGTCNPWETRYRYRNGERLCPECGKPAVIKGKEEYGGGWLCFKKKDGCGAKWRDGDQLIEGQTTGQVENENPWDLENTIAKMAEKRAHVDGTIRATGTSGLFTQDDDSPAVPKPNPPAQTQADFERDADGSLIGIAESTDKGLSDFEVRWPADGRASLGFRLRSGGSVILVECRGPLAEQLFAFREATVGQRVTVWGAVGDRTFPKGRGTVTYQVLAAERIRIPEVGDLPTAVAPIPDGKVSDLDTLDF